MLIPSFETTRLIVDAWEGVSWRSKSSRDVENAMSLILTEPVLRDLPPSLHLEGRSVRDWISERAKESDLYLISQKGVDTPIGVLILAVFEETNGVKTIHLGYLFSERHWGQGYATELIKGLVASAKSYALIALRGGVAVSNPSSASVLKKAGFLIDDSQQAPDMQHFVLNLS